MKRTFIFITGLVAGTTGTVLIDRLAFPDAAAAPAAEVQRWKLRPAQPLKAGKPQLRARRCAAGFKAATGGAGRYGCRRLAAVRCANGAPPSNLQLYRSGNDAASSARLIYDCQTSETVRPLCAQGFIPANLKLYRSGNASGGARLIYECIRYRKGN